MTSPSTPAASMSNPESTDDVSGFSPKSSTSATSTSTGNIRASWQGIGTQNVSLLIALGLLVAVFGLDQPTVFFRPANLIDIGSAVSLLAVVSLGETLVILSGGLDISVGSATGLASVASAWAMVHITGSSVIGIAGACAVGLLAGLLNGVVITYGRVNPVIATLGTLSAFQGVAFLVAGGQSIPVKNLTYIGIGTSKIAGLPVTVVIAIIAAIVFALFLRVTDIGRNIYALGGNPVAARLAGIPVNRYRVWIYAVSGLVAGLAGVILTARTQNGVPASGSAGLELSAITAVVLGGAALTGGRGTIVGTMYGVLIIGVLQNGLTILNVQTFYQQVATGSLLVVAVMIQQFRSDRPWADWRFLRRPQ